MSLRPKAEATINKTNNYTYIHTHTHIYIYIYMYVVKKGPVVTAVMAFRASVPKT